MPEGDYTGPWMERHADLLKRVARRTPLPEQSKVDDFWPGTLPTRDSMVLDRMRYRDPDTAPESGALDKKIASQIEDWAVIPGSPGEKLPLEQAAARRHLWTEEVHGGVSRALDRIAGRNTRLVTGLILARILMHRMHDVFQDDLTDSKAILPEQDIPVLAEKLGLDRKKIFASPSDLNRKSNRKGAILYDPSQMDAAEAVRRLGRASILQGKSSIVSKALQMMPRQLGWATSIGGLALGSRLAKDTDNYWKPVIAGTALAASGFLPSMLGRTLAARRGIKGLTDLYEERGMSEFDRRKRLGSLKASLRYRSAMSALVSGLETGLTAAILKKYRDEDYEPSYFMTPAERARIAEMRDLIGTAD